MTSKATEAHEPVFCPPDLTQRPFKLTVERMMVASPSTLSAHGPNNSIDGSPLRVLF